MEAPSAQEPEVLEPEEQVQQDDLDRLTELFEEKPTDTEEILEKKKKLLKKIGEFGHFSTTKVEYNAVADNSDPAEEGAQDTSDTEKKAESKKSAPDHKNSRDNLSGDKKRIGGKKQKSPQSLKANPLKFESGRSNGGSSDEVASGIVGSEDDPFRFVLN